MGGPKRGEGLEYIFGFSYSLFWGSFGISQNHLFCRLETNYRFSSKPEIQTNGAVLERVRGPDSICLRFSLGFPVFRRNQILPLFLCFGAAFSCHGLFVCFVWGFCRSDVFLVVFAVLVCSVCCCFCSLSCFYCCPVFVVFVLVFVVVVVIVVCCCCCCWFSPNNCFCFHCFCFCFFVFVWF